MCRHAIGFLRGTGSLRISDDMFSRPQMSLALIILHEPTPNYECNQPIHMDHVRSEDPEARVGPCGPLEVYTI